MACHCRRVVHPILGQAVACISIHSTCFLPCLEKVVPVRWRALDLELQTIFIHPRYEPELRQVAASHFGMGMIWDEAILRDWPSWNGERTAPPRKRTRTRVEPDLMAAIRTLGAEPDATLAQARRAYRRASMRLHPDRGGSSAAMAELNQAWEVVRERLTRAR